MPDRIAVASVDHGLRAERAGEAAMVADLCAGLGVPHDTLRVRVEAGNLQANARAARYAALGKWAQAGGCEAVATAHHADDQAETLLMRLNRGSGLAGLAGVRPRTAIEHATVVRPLLGWRKAELEAVCARCGVEPARDPSNADPAFDRARIRAGLAASDWLDPAGLATSAAHLRDTLDGLAALVDEEWRARVEGGETSWTYRPGPSDLLALEVLRGIVARFGTDARRSELARMVARLRNGENASLGGVLAVVKGDRWHFAAEPPRHGD